jgi:hypothetical protein
LQDIASLFGAVPLKHAKLGKKGHVNGMPPKVFNAVTQVFPKSGWNTLFNVLRRSMEAGGPATFLAEYPVQANPYQAVTGGWKVRRAQRRRRLRRCAPRLRGRAAVWALRARRAHTSEAHDALRPALTPRVGPLRTRTPNKLRCLAGQGAVGGQLHRLRVGGPAAPRDPG